MVLVAVRRQTLRQEVTRILCRYIAEAPLQKGDQLPGQRDLADYLQVSRTVVREALSSLEARGIVEIRPGMGAVVRDATVAIRESPCETTDVSGVSPRDLFEFRVLLYMGLPELVCAHATEDDIRRMRQLLDVMEAKLAHGRTILGEVQELMWQIAAATRNQLVLGLRSLANETGRQGLLVQSSILGRPTAMAAVHLARHREMVDAIEARDPDRLRRVFREEFGALPGDRAASSDDSVPDGRADLVADRR